MNYEVKHYHGKFSATVVDNAPDAAEVPGSLQVSIERFRELEPGSATVTARKCIARPCLPPGAFILPAVGTRVWVEFQGGDLSHPIWTGAWYPKDAAPATPEGEQPQPDHRLLRSVSGHTICLDDTAGSERIVVQDANKNVLTMSQEGIEIKCGERVSVILKSDGIELKCGDNALTIDSGGMAYKGQALLLDSLLPLLVAHKHSQVATPDAGLATLPMDPSLVTKPPG